MFEPCVVGFCFPFLSHSPWQMFSFFRTLQQMWKEDQVSQGFILRKFLLESRRFPHMQDVMVRNMLYFTLGAEVPQTTGSKKSEGKPGTKRKMEEQKSGQKQV